MRIHHRLSWKTSPSWHFNTHKELEGKLSKAIPQHSLVCSKMSLLFWVSHFFAHTICPEAYVQMSKCVALSRHIAYFCSQYFHKLNKHFEQIVVKITSLTWIKRYSSTQKHTCSHTYIHTHAQTRLCWLSDGPSSNGSQLYPLAKQFSVSLSSASIPL